MPDDFKPLHGFRLNVVDGAGQPSIFLLPVFPESVVDVKVNAEGGSSITVRMSNGESVTLGVTQPPGFVQEMMRRCKELDQRAGSSENRES